MCIGGACNSMCVCVKQYKLPLYLHKPTFWHSVCLYMYPRTCHIWISVNGTHRTITFSPTRLPCNLKRNNRRFEGFGMYDARMASFGHGKIKASVLRHGRCILNYLPWNWTSCLEVRHLWGLEAFRCACTSRFSVPSVYGRWSHLCNAAKVFFWA